MSKHLYIIRGHSGSGKTIFAKSLLANVQNGIHLENDLFMTDKDGRYQWSEAA